MARQEKVAVTFEMRGLDRLILFAGHKNYDQAIQNTLTYVARAARTKAGQEISARYGIKSSRVKLDIGEIEFVPYGGEAVIPFSLTPPTVRAYSGSFTVSGSAKTLSSGARGVTTWTIYKGERVRSSNVFWRRSRTSGRILPFISEKHGGTEHKYYNGIRAVYGPSIGGIFFGDSRFGSQIKRAVSERMAKSFEVGLGRELRRFGRGF